MIRLAPQRFRNVDMAHVIAFKLGISEFQLEFVSMAFPLCVDCTSIAWPVRGRRARVRCSSRPRRGPARGPRRAQGQVRAWTGQAESVDSRIPPLILRRVVRGPVLLEVHRSDVGRSISEGLNTALANIRLDRLDLWPTFA